ncbi:hypothetical protein AB0I53_12955 [Saccharopolyspora sp. NPDC050389]|uniref:hypothetical protein n=1 Tax=Saccharopolyspora sp. NPDC050389 TaxID=3155516 RepID=UPI0033C8CF0E
MHRTLVGAVSLSLVLASPSAAAAAPDQADWQLVGDGITSGISGIALVDATAEATDAIIVRDNKKDGENRATWLSLRQGQVTGAEPLDWQGEIPVDLEAIDAIPGSPGEYIALASDGSAFHVRIDRGGATVLGTFSLPDRADDDNYESFGLLSKEGRLFAVWADRGEGERPATLRAAEFDKERLEFGEAQSQEFRAPYPTKDVRHVSDLKLREDGRIVVSSASDSGDDGPFDSAVFAAGTLAFDGGALRLTIDQDPQRLGEFPGHKIEALNETGGLLLGSDDENAGSSVLVAGN